MYRFSCGFPLGFNYSYYFTFYWQTKSHRTFRPGRHGIKLLQQFFPPKIYKASEFELFKIRLKDKQRLWGLIYDYPIEHLDDNTVQLNIKNCPFAEAMFKLKVSEFGPYMCRGDWEVAKDNSDKWLFERSCTIATGGKICDFTYKKLNV